LATGVASTSSYLDFTIPATYKQITFSIYEMHGSATSDNPLQIQFSTDGGSTIGMTVTSTAFEARHSEAGTGGQLAYDTDADLVQGTGYQRLSLGWGSGNDNDQCVAGEVTLYSPASTTYVKHFIAQTNGTTYNNYTSEIFTAGYINSTSDVDFCRFRFSSGTMDSGTIKMWGVL
jgi:hypothetical protein